jgi:cytochrome b
MHVMPNVDARSGSRASAPPGSRLVIDAPTRMFHWLFALSFAGAYATAESEHWRLLHVTLGYSFAGLLVFRLLYGLLGPRQAGLALLGRRLAGAAAWVRSLRAARSISEINWRQGQNLAMALVMVTMMVLVVPLAVSGFGTYNDWGDWFEEAHEISGNALMALVLAHLGLIALLSATRRQNQALPMITGRVRGTGPSLVRKNRAWLAVSLLLTVLAFGAWQWRDLPVSPIPDRKGEAALGESLDVPSRPAG